MAMMKISASLPHGIHSGHFYSAPSSPLLLIGAPDYSTDTVSEYGWTPHASIKLIKGASILIRRLDVVMDECAI